MLAVCWPAMGLLFACCLLFASRCAGHFCCKNTNYIGPVCLLPLPGLAGLPGQSGLSTPTCLPDSPDCTAQTAQP
eukprot:3112687-Karenia_brevis.AAC.1